MTGKTTIMLHPTNITKGAITAGLPNIGVTLEVEKK